MVEERVITIDPIQKADFDQILSRLSDYWGDRAQEVRPLHHPMFLYEFGDSGLVIRHGDEVAAYLLGFCLESRSLGYIHFVGVRLDSRKQGMARALYERFFQLAAHRGCERIKAITSPGNAASISFHQALGFKIEEVMGYRGPGEHRVVFTRSLKQ